MKQAHGPHTGHSTILQKDEDKTMSINYTTYWQLTSGETLALNESKVKRMCCQTSPMSQLTADNTNQYSLEAEIVGGQGFAMGCSAIGWMDGWMDGWIDTKVVFLVS